MGRLIFPLCCACAEINSKACIHEVRERSWISGYTHFELNAALKLGYKVLDLFEVKLKFIKYIFRFGTIINGQVKKKEMVCLKTILIIF